MLEALFVIGCDPITCGPGTEEQDGRCVLASARDDETDADTDVDTDADTDSDADADADTDTSEPDAEGLRYELRVVSSEISADGRSKVPVFAIGTNTDGSAADDLVVFGTSRSDAGTFEPSSVALEPLGSSVYFTPCDATTAGCTGAVDLTLALASEPSTAVALVAANLVEPAGVSDPAPCLIGGNVMFLDGSDYVFSGTRVVTEAEWVDHTASREDVWIDATPWDGDKGSLWMSMFSTSALAEDLAVGVYEDAQREPFEEPGHPGMSVVGDGRGCNKLEGRFEIHEIEWEGEGLSKFTATFEQRCHGSEGLFGCVHYEL